MSQIADYNVANASGAAVRSDINNIFLAVASANSGTSEPSTMYPFMIWVDTTNDLVKLRNGANDAWLTLPYSMTASNTVDINGGTVDGTTIGSSSASTIVGTTVVANTSLNIASDGATVTGIKDEDDMSSNSAVKLATQQSIKAYVDSQVDTVDTLGEVLAIGNTTGGTDLAVSANDDITFTDSSKAIFGASSDLSIYHDGSNSYVDEQGTGNLYLKGSDSVRFLSSAGEDMVVARTDGAVELYHNNTLKLSTSTLGVNIGNTSTGFHSSVHPLIVGSGSGDEGMAIFSGSSSKGKIGFADAASDDSGSYRGYFQYDHAADGLNIGTAGSTRMTIDASGNAGIGVNDPDSNLDISGGSNKLGILRLTQRASGAAAYGLDMGLDPSSGDPVFSRIVSDAVSEVFRIQRSSGNVGIGTSNPAKLLTLSESTDGAKLRINRGGVAEWDFSIGGTSTLTGVGAGALELLPQNGGTANEFAIGTAGGTAPLFHLTTTQNYFAKKVGIGVTSPTVPLHVGGADASDHMIVSSSADTTRGLKIATYAHNGQNNAGVNINAQDTGHANYPELTFRLANDTRYAINADGQFWYHGSEKMRLTAGGGLCVGSTSGADAGGIITTVGDNYIAFTGTSSGRTNIALDSNESGGAKTFFRTAGSGNYGSGNGDMYILNESGTAYLHFDLSAMTVSGDLVDTSDENLKENIEDIQYGLETLKQMKPRTFDWIDENKGNQISGFIAQEVQELMPDDVSGSPHDEGEKGSGLGINTVGVLAVAVKAIQELSAEVEQLKQQAHEKCEN